MDLVINGGTVVTAAETFRADIGVTGGHIVSIGEQIPIDGARAVDATGRYVMPGAIDPHTHMDMPWTLGGDTDDEAMRAGDDFESGTVAAACGGITTIIDFCLSRPGVSLGEALQRWHEKAKGKALVDYGFHIILTDWRREILDEIPDLISAGYPTFKVFMPYAIGADDKQLLATFDTTNQHGGLTLVHCENACAVAYLSEGFVERGELGLTSHYRSRPPAVEGEATGRARRLAALVGSPFYNVHLSSSESLDEIRQGKAAGEAVYAETCPHFLTLTRDLLDLPGLEGTKFACTPPLRERSHLEALWVGLRSGDLSVMASDHVAWGLEKHKSRGRNDFRKLPHGLPSIETMIPVVYSEGVGKGRISLNTFVAITSTNAAKIFGLYPRKGAILPGADADFMLIDPNSSVTITQRQLHQRVDFTPWEGWTVVGLPTTVISRGEVIVDKGTVVGTPGRGRFLKRAKFTAERR